METWLVLIIGQIMGFVIGCLFTAQGRLSKVESTQDEGKIVKRDSIIGNRN